jgi:large subunit ribosomal protein L20
MRVKGGPVTHRRHKQVLKRTKGFEQGRRRLFRRATEAWLGALSDSYRDRRTKKRDFRRLWIQRINAAARQHGLPYGRFMNGLRVANVEIDRKMLADLAVREPAAFAAVVEVARQSSRQ